MRKLWFALLISIVVAAIVGLTGRVILPHNGQALGTIESSQTATPSPSATASAPPSSAVVTARSFTAKFSGTLLNKTDWATCYPWSPGPLGCTNFGNHESEWYLPAQDKVYDGALHLVAHRQTTKGRPNSLHRSKWYACRSGMVTTYPSFQFEYGYVKIVARIPNNPGLWSGLWLASANKQETPEVDILEHWGLRKKATGVFYHPGGGLIPFAQHPVTGALWKGWHTFSLRWTRTKLSWFIDGQSVMTDSFYIPHQPMYFIADLADYLPHPDKRQCTGSLLIQSVKISSPDVTYFRTAKSGHERGRKHHASRAHR
jgi:beta-glucanase (GH16 family)